MFLTHRTTLSCSSESERHCRISNRYTSCDASRWLDRKEGRKTEISPLTKSVISFANSHWIALQKEELRKLVFHNGEPSKLRAIVSNIPCLLHEDFGMRRTPLHIVCMNGYLKLVEVLLDLKPNLNCTNLSGETPLWNACSNGHFKVVKKLLSCGADVNKVRKFQKKRCD